MSAEFSIILEVHVLSGVPIFSFSIPVLRKSLECLNKCTQEVAGAAQTELNADNAPTEVSCQLWRVDSNCGIQKIFPSSPDGDNDHLQPNRNNYEDISFCVYSSTLQMGVPPNSCNLLRNYTASHPKIQ